MGLIAWGEVNMSVMMPGLVKCQNQRFRDNRVRRISQPTFLTGLTMKNRPPLWVVTRGRMLMARPETNR